MEAANFPLTQLLDFLPPVVLHNLVASGNYTFYHPIEANEAFRNTYDPRWLDTSKYRYRVDFTGWFVNKPVLELIHYYFALLISDPAVDDRMHTNNETMELSFSILHLSDFNATNAEDGDGALSRAECNFTRNVQSTIDDDAVLWLWTNDTSAITSGYKVFWTSSIGR
ncbi:hypothetical protein F5Y10DRAFT_271860 [Nemania abortiva]|nr:hypothetical protein F5Y10DRAFT_271860 [Nemania abortiva]